MTRTMRRERGGGRLFAPATAAALVTSIVCVVVGCIPVPGDYAATDRRERPEQLIGVADSDRPLRTSQSTLPNVIAWLGMPLYASPGWQAVVYRYEVRSAVLFRIDEPPRDLVAPRFLVVRFAPSGSLDSSQVYARLNQIPEHRRAELQVARRVPSPPGPRGSVPDPP